MEVLFISHKYPPEIGGMQKQSYELITGFQQRHQVHKIVIKPNENRFRFFATLKKRVQHMMNTYPTISIVHCNDGVCGYFCRFIKSKYNVPVLITFHGLDLLWPLPLYRRLLKRKYNKWFSGFITVSSFTAKKCKELIGDNENTFVIPNGVDVNLKSQLDPIDIIPKQLIKKLQKSKKRILISIGRPTKRKGFSWFINSVLKNLDHRYHYLIIGPESKPSTAVKVVFKVMPKSILNYIELFFGSSNDQEQLNKYKTVDNFLVSNTTWLTNCNYKTLMYLLQNADLFIMPNVEVEGDAEGFGLVALESVMQDCYVLASNIDGIPSAIHNNKNGKLLMSKDANVWVSSIQEYFNLDSEKKEYLKQKSKVYTINNFSWEKMVINYENVFEAFSPSLENSGLTESCL